MKPYKITKPIRLIELFGGIGAQAAALESLGVPFEHYRVVEFDKFAIKSYNAIHRTEFEPIDITGIHGADLGIVDTDKYEYICCYSFPCQDLSNAGLSRGMEEGTGTRSALLWEVKRLLDECEELPQILVMENVPQVHNTKNMESFQKWLDYLTSRGYSNFWQDMNAKCYGVAQSRNRCFCVSILGDHCYEFPKGWELDKTMRDYLEEEVDEKYYINNEKAEELIEKLIVSGDITKYLESANAVTLKNMGSNADKTRVPSATATSVAPTILARDYKGLSNYGTGGVIEKTEKRKHRKIGLLFRRTRTR